MGIDNAHSYDSPQGVAGVRQKEIAVSSAFVVSTQDLPRANVGGVDDPSAMSWCVRLEPGGRLGWHRPGDVFVIPTPVRLDPTNSGQETLRAVAFLAAPMFTQQFDNVMLALDVHVLGTPNRNG